MFYTVYKTTNQINGKFYIGKHITDNPYDDYLGSNAHLKNAIKKYGRENFIKTILECYDYEKQMDLAEKILVVIDKDMSYNLNNGGQGGFGHINRTITSEQRRINGSKSSYESRAKGGSSRYKKYGLSPSFIEGRKKSPGFTGYKHSPLQKQVNQTIHTCSHCGKIGKGPAMFRHHFDNCKEYKLENNDAL